MQRLGSFIISKPFDAVLSVAIVLLLSSTVQGSGSSFGLTITPMPCSQDAVATGSGSVTSVQPEECPVETQAKPVTGETSQDQTTSTVPNQPQPERPQAKPAIKVVGLTMPNELANLEPELSRNTSPMVPATLPATTLFLFTAGYALHNMSLTNIVTKLRRLVLR